MIRTLIVTLATIVFLTEGAHAQRQQTVTIYANEVSSQFAPHGYAGTELSFCGPCKNATAFSSSTATLYFDDEKPANVSKAIFRLIWAANSTAARVQLVLFSDFGTNLTPVTTATYLANYPINHPPQLPVATRIDVTNAIRSAFASPPVSLFGPQWHVGIKSSGDGENAPVFYAASLEIMWE